MHVSVSSLLLYLNGNGQAFFLIKNYVGVYTGLVTEC